MPKKQRKLEYKDLEERRLLAVTAGLTEAGELAVRGNADGEVEIVQMSENTFQISDGGNEVAMIENVSGSISVVIDQGNAVDNQLNVDVGNADIDFVFANLGDGANTFSLNGETEVGNVVFVGGDGADQFDVNVETRELVSFSGNAGSDVFNLNADAELAQFFGGVGNDTAFVDNSTESQTFFSNVEQNNFAVEQSDSADTLLPDESALETEDIGTIADSSLLIDSAALIDQYGSTELSGSRAERPVQFLDFDDNTDALLKAIDVVDSSNTSSEASRIALDIDEIFATHLTETDGDGAESVALSNSTSVEDRAFARFASGLKELQDTGEIRSNALLVGLSSSSIFASQGTSGDNNLAPGQPATIKPTGNNHNQREPRWRRFLKTSR